ncbi:MAG TPA: formylglycine-generating enzyme family protein [Kofleriaceae bacterium]|nr:formylglycine-generating enzyme family protein [Kofleriaceae bacterium]
MSRQRAGALLIACLASGCLATPDFSGTCYRCSEAHPECPSGQTCVNDVCSDARTGLPAAACTLSGAMGDSCAQLKQGCGPAGGSCCETLPVPGGMFVRSHDLASDNKYESTANPATVSDFRLDRYEVTVGRFRAFVVAGMGTTRMAPATGAGAHPHLVGSGWQAAWSTLLASDTASLEKTLGMCTPSTWTDVPGENEKRPINCITWYEAMAFCIWDGGYLPTEAEWNYAAAGGAEQRVYPWSTPTNPDPGMIDPSFAVYASGANPVDVGTTSPKGDGLWGHSDLGGNVWEWTLDAVPDSKPNDDPMYQLPCPDCANLIPGSTNRLQRGGGFSSPASDLRAGERAENVAAHASNNVGMRCARPAT